MAPETNEVSRDSAGLQSSTEPAPSPSTTEIRTRIEHTRAELSETIDAIQARLSPSRVLSEAKQSVADATVGRVRRLVATSESGAGDSLNYQSVVGVVTANPVPFLFVGAAVTALVAGSLMRARQVSGWGRQHHPAEPLAKVSNGSRLSTGRLLLGACMAGLACWSASRVDTDDTSTEALGSFSEPNAPLV